MKRSILLLTLTVFLLDACATTHARPSWINGPLPKQFSCRECLVGMGLAMVTRDREGDVRRADAAAFSEIARQIQVRLKEEMVTESEYSSRSNLASGTIEDRSFDKITIKGNQAVEFTLEGARIVDRFYDEKTRTHYSLAILEKVKTASRLNAESNVLLRDSGLLMSEGLALLDKGEIVPGIKKLIVSTDKYEAACGKRATAAILSGSPAEPVKAKDPRFRLQEAVDRIAIECVSGNGQQARAGVPLPRPVVVRAVYTKGSPVVSMPLAVSVPGQAAKPESIPLTDEKGTAIIPIPEIGRTGVSRNAIRITPAWDEVVRSALNGLPASWENRFGTSRSLQVAYFLRTENTTSVTVVSPTGFWLEDGSGRVGEGIVVQPLVGSLKAAGFVVRQAEKCSGSCSVQDQAARFRGKTDLLVVVDGSLGLSDWRGNVPLYRASLTFTCYDCIRGEIIGSMEGRGIGGAPDRRRSAEKALAAAADEYIPGFVRGIQDRLP